MHTAEHFRRELWFPRVLDRQYFAAWLEGGAESTEDRCRRRKQELLTLPGAAPLDQSLDREVERIVQAARRELEPGAKD